MKIVLKFLWLGIILMSFSINAQKREYDLAKNLANEALNKLQIGAIQEADSLIKKSIAMYPVYDVLNYCSALAQLPDVLGANMIMTDLKEKVSNMPDKILCIDPVQRNMPNPVLIPVEYEKSRALFIFLMGIYEVNRLYGSRPFVIQSLADLQKTKMVKKKLKPYEMDYEITMQRAFNLANLLYNKEFDAAEKFVNDMEITISNPKEVILMYKINIEILKENYTKAEEMTQEMYKNAVFTSTADIIMFKINTLQGDNKALEYYNKIDPKLKENNSIFYQLALFYLKQKNYPTALINLDKSNALRKEKVIIADMIVEGWDFYRAYGDVYSGLKEYEKARNNYNISLLYNPDDKQTKDALDKMELLVNAEAKQDKTAPEIAITEPVPSRGLEVVTAMNDVMIKGIAQDVSAIKEVSINGVKVYSQPNGNFWGNVPMKNGANKILVVATDISGNTAEKSFEIQKSQTSSSDNKTTNISTNEKVGKNYCLLIAAQNYFDTSIPSLNKPVADAIKLKIILKRDYGFDQENIFSLFNPTTNDIKRQLLELTNTIQPKDNLVIFYAGHGIWVEKEKKGYWLMTDAQYKDTKTWLPNKDVLDLVAKLPARHTLLITDACFSGSVFKTRGIPSSAPAAIKELDNKISRVAITSGNDTEVPDESVFMKYLVKALTENKEKYLTAQKMFINQIIEAVMTETKTEPRYGTLELAGHVGGDFIFIKK